MSSAEVFSWGSLGPVPGEDTPAPVRIGRRGLVHQVHAGAQGALLAREQGVEWLPTRSGLRNENAGGAAIPRNSPGVKCAAFGQDHALLLHEIGTDGDGGGEPKTEVLGWGLGEQGQLGLGAGTLESKLPKTIPALSAYRVVQVACGAQHSAAVTSHGDLFTWGRGLEGQLGHSSRHLSPELNDAITGVQFRPKPVPAFLATKKRQRPVAGVSCGAKFTLVLTRAGEAWAFGEGVLGQLGIGRLTCAGEPRLVMPSCPATGEQFVQVAAGWAHSLARTSGGRLYSWGFNALGSLGLGDHRTRFLPEVVPLGGGRLQAVDGGADGSGGDLAGSRLARSSGDATKMAVKIGACGNCSGALTAEGELFTWGCNNGGLGHRCGGERRRSRPEGVEHVLRPRRVERLSGADVTDFSLSNEGGVALVPLRVKSIEPVSGPLETGCKVLIQGNGFWDSPDIVVKFTPVSKGNKPSASRSAVGTYVPREVGQGGHDLGSGSEFIYCMAPCFASPEAAYVEVSVDGKSFTTDRTKFEYYRTPEVTKVTPDTCRPPFPRLRLDGEQFSPSETLLIRLEEEAQEDDPGEAATDGDGVEGADLLGERSGNEERLLSPRSPPRVFVVPGRVESEVIEIGTDPDTDLPIHEKRSFITCDSPALPPGAKLPFISRLTVAPNGVDFNGEPLRFVAHDPHADLCLPAAVPVPVVSHTGGDVGDDELPGGAEPEGPRIRITGRNLYRGADLSVRLRFGLDDEEVVPFETVYFDPASESIVALVPAGAEVLVAGEAGAARKEQSLPPAISVVVEVSVHDQEYFAVPERLTVYRYPRLTLHGDGLYPICGGGWAEIKTAEAAFRGHEAMVRLVSHTHGIDVALPLLSSPPPEEVEEGAEEASGAPFAGDGGGTTPLVRPALANASKETSPPAQGSAEGGGQTTGPEQPCDDTSAGDVPVWEEREVPASKESFFFAVPPLPSASGCLGGEEQDDVTAAEAATPEDQSVITVPSKGRAGGGDGQDAKLTASPEEVKMAVSLLVSLNGSDWQPVSGPPLTYFPPPPEPEPEPEEEPKKGKGKKK